THEPSVSKTKDGAKKFAAMSLAERVRTGGNRENREKEGPCCRLLSLFPLLSPVLIPHERDQNCIDHRRHPRPWASDGRKVHRAWAYRPWLWAIPKRD